MRLFDSHAHLTDESFSADLDDVLARAAAAGVERVVAIASDLSDAARAIALARRGRPRVLATAGLHPHRADRWDLEAQAALERLAGVVEVVALGETGLDFHYENAPRRAQLDAFRGQLELAERSGLPVVVHCRDADEAMSEFLREFAGRVSGVLHCFTGGRELLEAGLESGWYISFSGIVTFKNYGDAALVRQVPGDRLLVETDSPYLAPSPLRGRRNEPAFVAHVVRRVAELRGEDPERVAEASFANACRLYGLGDPTPVG